MDLKITGPLVVDDAARMIRAALEGVGLAFVLSRNSSALALQTAL